MIRKEFSTKIPEIMDRRRLNWVICIKFTRAVPAPWILDSWLINYFYPFFIILKISATVLIARADKSFRFIIKFNKNIIFGPNDPKWSIKYETCFKFKMYPNV